MPIVEKKTIDVVKCCTCGKEYKTERKALECEDSHRCECSKKIREDGIKMTWLSHQYKNVGFATLDVYIYIDFKYRDLFEISWNADYDTNRKLQEVQNRKLDNVNYKHLLDIDYCPLCGRDLKVKR